MTVISASVGLGGENRRADVIVVQSLLKAAGVSPGIADGRCGRLTIHAIEQFQSRILRDPDGRVDVRGPTLRHLLLKPAHARHPSAWVVASVGDPETGPSRIRHTVLPSVRLPARHPVSAVLDAPPAYDFWRQHTALPDPSINAGLVCPSSSQMMEILGDPNGSRAKSHMATESVGPFRATGLKPALMSMRAIFSRVHHDLPDLYGLLGSNGMRTVRQVRNGRSYSNHAWGIAIDLLIALDAPKFGAPFSFRGLDALVPYFHKAGWYWGGGYRNNGRKDAMHFECGLALIRSFNL